MNPSTRANWLPLLRRFVERHQGAVGLILTMLVVATLAFDYFVGFGGENLMGLRVVYTALMLLLVAYMYTVSTMKDEP